MASWVQGTPRVYRTCCVLFSGERVQSLKQILRWGRVPKEAESPYSRQLRGVWRGPGGSRGRGPLTHASPASSDTQTSKCSPFLTSPHHRPVARAAWSWERARPCGVTGPPPPNCCPCFPGQDRPDMPTNSWKVVGTKRAGLLPWTPRAERQDSHPGRGRQPGGSGPRRDDSTWV